MQAKLEGEIRARTDMIALLKEGYNSKVAGLEGQLATLTTQKACSSSSESCMWAHRKIVQSNQTCRVIGDVGDGGDQSSRHVRAAERHCFGKVRHRQRASSGPAAEPGISCTPLR